MRLDFEFQQASFQIFRKSRYYAYAYAYAPSIWLARWPKFLRSLLTGPSPEAVVVARMAADVRSTVAANKRLVEECCGRPAEVRAGGRGAGGLGGQRHHDGGEGGGHPANLGAAGQRPGPHPGPGHHPDPVTD